MSREYVDLYQTECVLSNDLVLADVALAKPSRVSAV